MSGAAIPDAAGGVVVRPLRESDCLQHLTELLHRAYRPLAEAGMRFVASWQPVEETRRRATGPGRDTIVAEVEGRIVGTVTLIRADADDPCEHYRKPGVLLFGQFAVEPTMQGRGIGRGLLERAEALARARGAEELALDTSEHAAHLIRSYERLGFALVGRVRWDSVNYESVVMSKPLREPGASGRSPSPPSPLLEVAERSAPGDLARSTPGERPVAPSRGEGAVSPRS